MAGRIAVLRDVAADGLRGALRLSARLVSSTWVPVTRMNEASVAPLTRISPAMNRNTARMCAPTLENRCETAQNSAWPMIPPRVSNEAAVQ